MFKPEQRNIYRYWNGTKKVFADPMRISQKMLSCYPKESTLEIDWKLLVIDKPESLEAMARVVKFARTLFDLPEYDEDEQEKPLGLTDAESLAVLVDFGQWVEDVKKNTLESPTLQQPTDAASSNTEEKQSPTNCILHSGQTVSDSSTEKV